MSGSGGTQQPGRPASGALDQSASVRPALSASVRPALSASVRPALSASVRPALSASVRPALSASVRPALSASVRPALSASVRPALSASVRPALSASVRPALSASALSASIRPALSTSASVGPVLSASAHPALSASVRPALSASVRPALSASVRPAQPASVRSAQSTSVGPALSASALSASVGPALSASALSASVRPAQSISVRPALSASALSASVGPALSASVRPAQSASVGPAQSASVRPAQSGSVGPAQSASVGPAQSASVRPAQSASVRPAQSASVRPALSASALSASALSPSVGPALSASVCSALSASVRPAQSASVRPAQSASVRPALSASALSASVGPALSASVRPAQSASVGPAQSASVGPALSASVRPAQSASVGPAQSASVRPALSASALSASVGPALSASVGPAQSASVGPAQSASVGPALSASVRPAQSASVRPAQSASVGPALSTSVRPAQSASALSASVGPAQSASVGPAQSASVGPALSASVRPAQSASVRPAQSASVGPALSTSVRPAQSASEHLDQSASEHLDQSDSEHLALSASEHLDQSASEHLDQSASESIDESASEDPDQSASEELDQSASEELDQSASEDLDQSASENLDQSASEYIDQSVSEYIDQSASGDPDQSASGTLDRSSSVDLDNSVPGNLDQSAHGVLDPSGLDQSSSVDLSQSASDALDMSASGDLDKSDPGDLDHSASQSDHSVVSESADVCLTLDETTGSLMGSCGEDLARPTDQHKSGEVSEGTPHRNETEATKPNEEEEGSRVGDGSGDTKPSDPLEQEKGKVTSVPESPDRRQDAEVSEETQSNTDLQRPRERPTAPKEEQNNGSETSGGKKGEECEGAGSDGSENGPSGGPKRGIKLPGDKSNGHQREDLPKPEEDSSGDAKEDTKNAKDDKRKGVLKRADAVNGDGEEDEQQPGEERSRDAEDTQEVLQPHITESQTRFAADRVEHGETLLAASVHGKRRRQQAQSPFHGGQLGPVAGGSGGRDSGQADSETHPGVTLGAAWPHAASQTEPPHVPAKMATNRSARQRKVWHSLKKWTPLGKLASSSDLDRYRSNTLDTVYSLAEFTSNLVLKATDMTIGEAAVDWLDDSMAKGVLVVLGTVRSWMESESFERLMKMISCFLCSTWIGKSVTAVTSYSSLTASRMLAVVDRTYDWLGLTTGGGRTRKQTLRHHGLATLLQLLNSTLLYFRDSGLDNVQHSRSKTPLRSAELWRESEGSPRGPKCHGPGSSRGVGGLNLGGRSPGGGSSKTRQGLGGGRDFSGGASGGGLGSGGRRDKDGEEDSVGGGGRRWQSEEGRGSGGRGHGEERGPAGGRRKTKSDGEDEGEGAGRRRNGCTEPGRWRGEGQPDGSGNGRQHGPTDEERGEDPGGKAQGGSFFQTQAGRQGNGRVGMTTQGVSARGSNPSHENPKHANRQGYEHTTGGYDRFAGRCRLSEGTVDVFDRRGSAGTSSGVETLGQDDLPRRPSQTTAARGASSTCLSQHSHSPDDVTRNGRQSPTRSRKGLEVTSRYWQEMSSTPYTTNGVHGPPRVEEEDLVGDEDDYHQIDDMTISVLDEVREVTVIPRSKEQRCQETYSRLTSSCPAKGAGGQWPRTFPGRLAATQTRGPGEEEEEEAAGFVGEHVSPAAAHWWTATGRRSDLEISYDVTEDIAERKITPVKRRLGGARKGSGPSPFRLHLPPTMPCSPGFGDLSVGNQFLCLLRKVPLLADIIRDPRDPPALTYVFDVPTFITDDRMRRLLDLAHTRRAGRDLKRKVSEVYSEEDYNSEGDPDYEPEELDTTDPLEYTEGEAAGVSAEEADVIHRDVTRSVEAEVHREERSWRSCSADSDKENSRLAHRDLHVGRAPLSTEEMPDATKPSEYSASDAAGTSGDGTKYVDVKEYKGDNFREPETQTGTEEDDVHIVEPEK